MRDSVIPKYVQEFEDCYFWKNVMLPSMKASILEAMDRLVYAKEMSEIRRLQTMIQTTQGLMGFPKRKHEEAVDDIEFEKDKHRGEDNEAA